MSPGTLSKAKAYQFFVRDVIAERGARCQCCRRTAQEARQKALHVHHLWPVAKSGIADGLVMSRANVIVACGYCHKLQHPGQREWPWEQAAIRRGAALR